MLTQTAGGRPSMPRSTWFVSAGSASGMASHVSLGRRHGDGDPAVGVQLGGQQPGPGLEGDPVAAGLLGDEPGDAAAGIAAGPGLAAVGVVEAHAHVGSLARLEQHELVEADAAMPVADPGDQLGVERQGSRLASRTTKSLPRPCIFRKAIMRCGIGRMGRKCNWLARFGHHV
jgi:hypothetical protein